MPKVLAPRLELFGRLANLLAELDESISETVRVEIWQTGTDEGFPEDHANRRGIAPVLPLQTGHFKLASWPEPNACCREKRIVIAP